MLRKCALSVLGVPGSVLEETMVNMTKFIETRMVMLKWLAGIAVTTHTPTLQVEYTLGN